MPVTVTGLKKEGQYEVKYTPTEIGPHHIRILHNGSELVEKICAVFDPKNVKVSKIGPGLVKRPVEFEGLPEIFRKKF